MSANTLSKKHIYFFNILDLNRNGFIQLEDFSELAERVRVIMDYEEESKEHKRITDKAARFFHKLVRDIQPKDGQQITQDELLEYLNKRVITDEVELDAFKDVVFNFMFDFFDQNRDGFISKKEYADFYTMFGIDEQHLEVAFKKLDNSKTEKLNRYDLLAAVEDFFTSDDAEASGSWVFGHWESRPHGS
ncbi:MAG: hypothetical protein Tsb0034_27880 [Ekhidna sp.]